MIKLLRAAIISIVEKIDRGDCYMSDKQIIESLKVLDRITTSNKYMNKYDACKFLHLSRATFDRYVALGKIPRGRHIQGLKELTWDMCELDKLELGARCSNERMQNSDIQ